MVLLKLKLHNMDKYKKENLETKRDLKFSVQVVILNERGDTLCVSRKDNHKDFGLPGGKVDPEDASLEDALIREVKEETGLIIEKEDLLKVYSFCKNGYMGHTYLCEKYKGEIQTDEPHVVKWSNFQEVTEGSFGNWNTNVSESLRNMGINFRYFKF